MYFQIIIQEQITIKYWYTLMKSNGIKPRNLMVHHFSASSYVQTDAQGKINTNKNSRCSRVFGTITHSIFPTN